MADLSTSPLNLDIIRLFVYYLYLICLEDHDLDSHYCSLKDPCRIASLALSPLLSLRTVSFSWNSAITALSMRKDHQFFKRVEDAYYPHLWHVNTKVRQAVLFRRYRVYRTISTENGNRGVYLAYDFGSASGCLQTEKVVVKAWTSNTDQECIAESKAYEVLSSAPGPITGMPSIYANAYDKECGVHAIVLQRLGIDLEDVIRRLPSGRFDDRMVLAVAIQMLDRYKYIHSQGLIHNGIKPGNICLPPSGSQEPVLYTIDFGFSFTYDISTSGVPPSAHRTDTVGNRNFLSVFGHHGITQSQRDDLESLAYLLSFLYNGDLPWAPATTDKPKSRPIKYEFKPQLWRLKMATPASVLFRNMDSSFVEFWRDVKSLAFGEMPDYDSMRVRFEDCWRKEKFGDYPGELDWWDILRRAKGSELL